MDAGCAGRQCGAPQEQSMSSLTRRSRSAQPDLAEFMPPNLRTCGSLPFGEAQRSRLEAWLREAAWPRKHMEMAELEGYLVALITWPVNISPGAWLPHIWGERGWKVPTKIATRARFDEFIALTMGFMQALDRDLSQQPPQLNGWWIRSLDGRGADEDFHRWGRGFMTALMLDSQGLKSRSMSARDAVRTIASGTAALAPRGPRKIETVVSAVLELSSQRLSRGPLGLMPAAAA
jgi:yecA family protein